MGNDLPVISNRQIVHRRNVFCRRLAITETTFPSINRMNPATTITESTGTGSCGIKSARRTTVTIKFTPAIIIETPRVEILTVTEHAPCSGCRSKRVIYLIESFRTLSSANSHRFSGLGRLLSLGQRRLVSSAVHLQCLLLLIRPIQR